MFEVRKADPADANKIFALYRKVAEIPIGLARYSTEITKEYIHHFMHEAAENGIEFVIDHPLHKDEIVAEIHCYRWNLEKFNHIFSELTIAVSQDFHGQGLGKLIFTHLLNYVEETRADILRVELAAQESNEKAIRFYKKLGFIPEGRFEKRIKLNDDSFEADIPMVWFNKNFSGKSKL